MALSELNLPASDPMGRLNQRLRALEEAIQNVRIAASTGGGGGTGPAGPAGPTGATGATGPAGADGTPKIIQDEGVDLPYRSKMDFVGTGVTAADDSANDRIVVTIPGSTGGGSSAAPIIVPLSGASSYTFTGLDGNTDGEYEVVVSGTDGGSPTGNVGIRCNGASTGYAAAANLNGSPSTPTVDSILLGGGEAGRVHYAVCRIAAETGRVRVGQANISYVTAGGVVVDGIATTRWSDTATNITSLQVYFGGGTFTGTVMLRKMRA